MAAALIIGFLGGTIFAAYRLPHISEQSATPQHQEAAHTLAALEKAASLDPNDQRLRDLLQTARTGGGTPQ